MNSWSGYQAGAAYWWQNTRATVLFEPAIRRMLEDGYTHFVELGPHPVLAASIFETAGKQRVSVMATQRRDHDDSRALAQLRWRTALPVATMSRGTSCTRVTGVDS